MFGTARAIPAISGATASGNNRKGKTMTIDFNNALAGFAALTLTVLCMATAIVPASPAGLLF
jgi:hypothetical protein